MGYRITYGYAIHKKMFVLKHNKHFKAAVTILIICVLLIGFGLLGWSNQKIRTWLLPGDAQVTEQAIDEFVCNIKEGANLSDAIVAFCDEIISNA